MFSFAPSSPGFKVSVYIAKGIGYIETSESLRMAVARTKSEMLARLGRCGIM